MTKYLLAAAALAAITLSGAAFAEDGKAKSTTPQAMSDSEMDKVTAGAHPQQVGLGVSTALSNGSPQGRPELNPPNSPVNAGFGRCTTAASLSGPCN